MNADLRLWLMLVTLGAIWGAAFLLAKLALEGYGPLWVGAGRLAIGAALITAIMLARGLSLPRSRRLWAAAFAAAAASNALPFTLLNWAQLHVPSGVAGVYMAVLPLIVLPMAHFLLPGERMTVRRTTGFLIGFLGVATLIGPATLSMLGGVGWVALAQFACLGATLCYASGSILLKWAKPPEPLGFAAATLILAAAFMLPIALAFDSAPDPFAWKPLLALLALGAGPTGFAMVLLLLVIERGGPSFLSLVNYQVPVWAVLYGAIFLSEPVNPRLGIALALILLGLAVAQNLVGRRRRVQV